MTRETHHHCQCDFCDGEDCKDLPVAPQLKGASTQELIDELRKRPNVECDITEPLDYYWITIMAEGDATDKIKGVGEATILVVKK